MIVHPTGIAYCCKCHKSCELDYDQLYVNKSKCCDAVIDIRNRMVCI